ncbi:hypothetical protein SSS_00539 [Sarcoptes scabiei]|uniref:Uncharacterized protein n=2 Tax=Sarcoptes scabiei TaxID=52283 RepID=A0A834RAF7_SARSC|nr:hypothetical protein SSS_00539 [Sarcoptes scabiei]
MFPYNNNMNGINDRDSQQINRIKYGFKDCGAVDGAQYFLMKQTDMLGLTPLQPNLLASTQMQQNYYDENQLIFDRKHQQTSLQTPTPRTATIQLIQMPPIKEMDRGEQSLSPIITKTTNLSPTSNDSINLLVQQLDFLKIQVETLERIVQQQQALLMLQQKQSQQQMMIMNVSKSNESQQQQQQSSSSTSLKQQLFLAKKMAPIEPIKDSRQNDNDRNKLDHSISTLNNFLEIFEKFSQQQNDKLRLQQSQQRKQEVPIKPMVPGDLASIENDIKNYRKLLEELEERKRLKQTKTEQFEIENQQKNIEMKQKSSEKTEKLKIKDEDVVRDERIKKDRSKQRTKNKIKLGEKMEGKTRSDRRKPIVNRAELNKPKQQSLISMQSPNANLDQPKKQRELKESLEMCMKKNIGPKKNIEKVLQNLDPGKQKKDAEIVSSLKCKPKSEKYSMRIMSDAPTALFAPTDYAHIYSNKDKHAKYLDLCDEITAKQCGQNNQCKQQQTPKIDQKESPSTKLARSKQIRKKSQNRKK